MVFHDLVWLVFNGCCLPDSKCGLGILSLSLFQLDHSKMSLGEKGDSFKSLQMLLTF